MHKLKHVFTTVGFAICVFVPVALRRQRRAWRQLQSSLAGGRDVCVCGAARGGHVPVRDHTYAYGQFIPVPWWPAGLASLTLAVAVRICHGWSPNTADV